MACSIIRYPLLRNPSVRYYSAAAAAQCTPSATECVKKLANKVTIAAVDNNNPVTQVSVIFKAGSRNETYETQGIAHMLRICTGLTSSRSSTFAITRNIQQLGGDLTTTSDREYVAYTLKITRNNFHPLMKFLQDVATNHEFRPWEISDEIPRLRYEVSAVPQYVRLVELLYKAAYRDGLGNSLYCPKRQIGKLSTETLLHFVKTHFIGPRCVVVGSGLSQCDLETFACALNVGSSENFNDPPTKYHGGEIRKERNSSLANVAIALEGSSFAKEKDALAFAVLQKVAGDGPKVKWGNNHSLLSKAIAGAAEEPFAISAFNASHSDSGLFGFILSAPGETAGAFTKAAVNWLRSPKFSDSDVAVGKTNLKASILAAGDSYVTFHELLGHQLLFTNNIVHPCSIAEQIDKISPADVKKVASQLSKGKITLASIGNLTTVPYIDQL